VPLVDYRVNGSLAVSRALGDYEYKNVEGKGQCEQLVSPEPEISVEPRDENHDEFMVLACDGVWDVMSNEDLVEFIRSRLRITNDLESICNQVIDTCLYKVCANISVVGVRELLD
jgi:serine/threonine protein phosphatase PrpC